MGHKHIGRKFVGGIDETPGTLKPGLKVPRTGKKIPAENDRRKAQACIGSPPDGTRVRHSLIDETLLVRCWGVSLPKWHDVSAKFELAAQNSGMEDRRQRFGQLK